MASIHKQPGRPNWFCAYYDPEGFRRFRSAGTSNERVANTICLNIERAAHLTRNGNMTNEKGLKLVRETCAAIGETHGKLAATRAESVLKAAVEEFIRISGGELTSYTIRTWFNTWIDGRTDASKATVIEYRRIIDLFLKFLGARSDRSLTTLENRQVEEFKSFLKKRVAPSTVNKGVKVLKAALNDAVKKRQLDFNPAQHVEAIQTESEGEGRRPFTAAELTKLLQVASAEWKTMIMLGYYTGQRLKDCANVTESKIHWEDGELALTQQKTNREQLIPLHPALMEYLEGLNTSDDPNAPICPAFFGKTASWLSSKFYDVMVSAGIAQERDHQKSSGNGRDGKRASSPISFHSLRYNCTSALKSAGVSDSVAMDIVGHETASISRNYTKIDNDAKRAAVKKLPDIRK